MSLMHLIYSSAAQHELSCGEPDAILHKSRANNARLGVTGMLLYIDGSFFQVLEGEAEIVDDLFLRIVGDSRHSNVTEIIREPIARRAFGNWSMGFARIDTAQIDPAIGLNDFFTTRSCLKQLDGGRAKKLLAAFASGRWRHHVAASERRVAVLSG